MVRISKIYTRTGDDGSTGLVDGSRTSKSSARVCAYGELDELNSQIGLIRTLAEQEKLTDLTSQLERIQNELFDLGSYLATPSEHKDFPVFQVRESHIKAIETWIDSLTAQTPTLTSFVLPGGSVLNSHLHIARTICRRVERSMVALNESEKVDTLALKYINRLSDLFFALAREESHRKGIAEYLWVPDRDRDS